jgi:UDP-glucose 4-epimerase
MKILLTGASSFTGYWFAQALAKAGHTVVAPLLSPRDHYKDGVRAKRVHALTKFAEVVPAMPFGSAAFMQLVHSTRPDVLCHHAAHVKDYRSADFDVAAALANNTRNLASVLGVLVAGGGRAVIATGSVFEAREGAGTEPLEAFSPYGLSKGFTSDMIAYHARQAGMAYGKFTIPNPFGPYEEPRFCAYLLRTWRAGETARVNTPDYVRDNIHVDLLARAYVRFVDDVVAGRRTTLHPSGYIESQGSFAERYAAALRPRLSLACGVACARQTEFTEPMIRINTEPAAAYVGDWDEATAWDHVAADAARA